ncbi:CD209 antigen-like protein A [Branchiostoma floridae x Branchiostoma belcheri]
MITNSEISSFMKTLSTDHKWFGLSDEGTEGQFVWEDGTRLTSTGFTDWYPGEPNGGGSEDCVQYWRHSWNDRSCTDQLGFTCEVQATTLTLPPPTTLITATSTPVLIPATNTIYPVRFTAVVGIPWNEEYRNPASMAYQELVNDTTQSVSKAFVANAAFHSVVVHDIS